MAAPMNEISTDLAFVVYTDNAQKMRCFLEEDGYWDSSRRLQRLEGDVVAIPVRNDILSALASYTHFISDSKATPNKAHLSEHSGKTIATGYYCDIPCHLVSISLPLSKRQLALSPHQRLVNTLRETFRGLDIPLPEEVQKEIPDVWEKHGDLILLPQTSFRSSLWQQNDKLWDTVAMVLGGQRVARKGRVKQDEFRSPRVELLLGNDGWVEHQDNGIRYNYDVRRCMFSVGNITEKMRVAGFNCIGETVIDLYAGIGYFTLPYLVHAKASLVHACEWNPDAATALRRNLALNGVQERCIVHQGDNKEVCPRGVADRINLGLIPTSEGGWPVACAALKPQSGGILHIHGNVTSLPKKTKEKVACVTKQNQPFLSKYGTPSGDILFRQQGVNSSTVCGSKGSSPTGFRTASPRQKFENSMNDVEYQEMSCDDREVEKCNLLDLKVDTLRNSDTTELSTCSRSGQTMKVASAKQEKANSSRSWKEYDDLHHMQLQQDTSDTRTLQDEGDKSTRTQELTAKDFWNLWADYTARKIQELIVEIHGGQWTSDVIHIEHVKSYAPHVDHIVVDVRCLPKNADITL